MVKLFANSGDHDQTPRSAASDLDLHCLPITFLGVSNGSTMDLGYPHIEDKCDNFWQLEENKQRRLRTNGAGQDVCSGSTLFTIHLVFKAYQSAQRLRCPHEETLHPWLSKMRPVKIPIRLRECTGWSESSLGIHAQKYGFLRCSANRKVELKF